MGIARRLWAGRGRDWKQWRGCESKHRFPSASRAYQRARGIRAEGGEKTYPYPCRYCEGWHLSRKWTDPKTFPGGTDAAPSHPTR